MLFLWFLAFCTCYVHFHTLYIFGSRVIYLVTSGLSFCVRLLLELLRFTVRLWFSSSLHSSCKFPRLLRFAVFLHSSCSVFILKDTITFLRMRKSLILEQGVKNSKCGNWHRAFTNPFASSSINFCFALKLLRIKDQWYTVLVKCQFVCHRVLSVLTSMPFDGTSSGGKCYGAGRRRLPFGSFQKGLENRERTEK